MITELRMFFCAVKMTEQIVVYLMQEYKRYPLQRQVVFKRHKERGIYEYIIAVCRECTPERRVKCKYYRQCVYIFVELVVKNLLKQHQRTVKLSSHLLGIIHDTIRPHQFIHCSEQFRFSICFYRHNIDRHAVCC